MKRRILRGLNKAKGACLAGSAMVVAGASNASAALDLTGVTLDTSSVDSVMGLVVVGLATLWGYRKVVKTMNRS